MLPEAASPSVSPDDSLSESRAGEQLLNTSDQLSLSDEGESRDLVQRGQEGQPQHNEASDPGVIDPHHVTFELGKAIQTGDTPGAVAHPAEPASQGVDASMDLTTRSGKYDAAVIHVEHTMQGTPKDSAAGLCSSDVFQKNSSTSSDGDIERYKSPTKSEPNPSSSPPLSSTSSHPPQNPDTTIPRESNAFTASTNGSKKKKPLQVSASLSYETEGAGSGASSPTARLRREERRSYSIDVPSIRIRSEDDSSDDDRKCSLHRILSVSNGEYDRNQQPGSSDADNALLQSDGPPSPGKCLNGSTKSPAQGRPYDQETSGTEPPNADTAEKGGQVNSSGPSETSDGSKLAPSFSLDVPEPKSLSLSLHRLEPNKRRRSQGEGILVEDKLITSSSMSRLPDGRRKSWTPDVSPRSSKGSIFDGEHGWCPLSYIYHH